MESRVESRLRCMFILAVPMAMVLTNVEWQKFQDLEEERIDFMKNSLWSFANIASTVCVSDDAVSLHNVISPKALCLLIHPSPARRFACPWKTARWRKTLLRSSKSAAPGKRSRTHQNSSTSAEEISTTMRPICLRMKPTRSRSSSEP